MGRYREVWTTGAAVIAVVGLFLACVSWSVGGALTVALSVAALVWMVTVVLGAQTGRTSKANQARGALLTGGGFVSMIGWLSFVGTPALVMWVLLAMSSPPTLRGFRVALARSRHNEIERLQSRLTPPPGHPQPELTPLTGEIRGGAPGELDALDVDELCRAWRLSYLRLQRATTVTEQLNAVQLRQHLLDELDRRSPERLSAWLASGARAARDPSRFIPGKPTDGH